MNSVETNKEKQVKQEQIVISTPSKIDKPSETKLSSPIEPNSEPTPIETKTDPVIVPAGIIDNNNFIPSQGVKKQIQPRNRRVTFEDQTKAKSEVNNGNRQTMGTNFSTNMNTPTNKPNQEVPNVCVQMFNKLQGAINETRTTRSKKKRVHWRDEPSTISKRIADTVMDFGANVLDQVADSWPLTLAAAATILPLGVLIVSATWIFALLAAVVLLGVCIVVAGGCLVASTLVFPLLLFSMGFISSFGAIFFSASLGMNMLYSYFGRNTDSPYGGGSPFAPATPLATPILSRNMR